MKVVCQCGNKSSDGVIIISGRFTPIVVLMEQVIMANSINQSHLYIFLSDHSTPKGCNGLEHNLNWIEKVFTAWHHTNTLNKSMKLINNLLIFCWPSNILSFLYFDSYI